MHLQTPVLRQPARSMCTSHPLTAPRDTWLAVPDPHSGAPDARALVRLAASCCHLSEEHPERLRLAQRVQALHQAPQSACRAVILDIALALGLDASLPMILRCAADAHAPLRQRARDLLAKSAHMDALAQAMLAETEDFEVQYRGLRLLHGLVARDESPQTPKARLLEAHLSAWQQHFGQHYVQAATAIAAARRHTRVVITD